MDNIELLNEKARWLRRETLKIHGNAPETRVASSLSDIEIFVTLYYGKILNFDPSNISWPERDRLIISKGHGAISFYPVLADLRFIDKDELGRVCQRGSILGSIPDTVIPGFETINGSLGHGLGVACGMAIALKRKQSDSKVFVLAGDGELYEGSMWEAIMFASHHKLNNLILIVDNNKISMLDYCKKILDLTPLESKFKAFNWMVKSVDGHNIQELFNSLSSFKADTTDRPKVLIANTIKGKGVQKLETDRLCHIKSLTKEEVSKLINEV